MSLTRRQLHKLGLLGGAALVLPRSMTGGALELSGRGLASPPVKPFTRPLIIPPVLAPEYSDDTLDFYRITMQQAELEWLSFLFKYTNPLLPVGRLHDKGTASCAPTTETFSIRI